VQDLLSLHHIVIDISLILLLLHLIINTVIITSASSVYLMVPLICLDDLRTWYMYVGGRILHVCMRFLD